MWQSSPSKKTPAVANVGNLLHPLAYRTDRPQQRDARSCRTPEARPADIAAQMDLRMAALSKSLSFAGGFLALDAWLRCGVSAARFHRRTATVETVCPPCLPALPPAQPAWPLTAPWLLRQGWIPAFAGMTNLAGIRGALHRRELVQGALRINLADQPVRIPDRFHMPAIPDDSQNSVRTLMKASP